MKNKKAQDLANHIAAAFEKVQHLNPNGLTDCWCLFEARNAHGVFLTPRQALKVAAMARASYELSKTVKGWSR
jgi:hypothetical protein